MNTVTRRSAMLAAMGLPSAVAALGAAAAKEFWDEKFPEDWTPAEIQRITNDSPWAQKAEVKFNGGPGGTAGFSRSGYYSPADQVKYSGGAATASPGTFHAVVRWASAKPVCAANKGTPDEASKFYILSMTGDFPDAAKPSEGDDVTAQAERGDMLRTYTKLDRKGDAPIYLDHIQAISGGEMYYFPRLDPIKPANKEITFSTKIGPLEFKAKFLLKDMLYRGKLEL
ncbi:MAG TPA: hypothetical protein VGG72_18355 [Bryobacteraceae bacterium]